MVPGLLIQQVKPAFRMRSLDVASADAYDMIFFAETRVIRIRLHLKMANESLSKAWVSLK